MRVFCPHCRGKLGDARTPERANELQLQHIVLMHGSPRPTQQIEREDLFVLLYRRVHLVNAHIALGADRRWALA